MALQYKLGQTYWVSQNGNPTQKQGDKMALQYKLGQTVWIAVDESQVITKEAYLDSAYTSSVSNINIEFPLGGYIEICGGVGGSTSAGSGGAGEKVIQKFNSGDSIIANISFIAGNKGSDGTTTSTDSHNDCARTAAGQYIYTCSPTGSISTVTAKGSSGAAGGFKINFKYLLRGKENSIEANGGGGAGGVKGSANYRRCSDSSNSCSYSSLKTYTLKSNDGNGASSTNGNSGNGANGGDATTNNNFKWRSSAIVNVWKYKEI